MDAEKGSRLFRETQAVAALRASLGEMANDDPELLADMIEGETSLFECFDRMLAANALDQAMADACAKAADEIHARGSRFYKRTIARRTLIEQAMMIAEVNKVERPLATLSITKGRAAVIVTEESDIPARFWKAGAPTLDKKAIADALKEGEAVPGATLNNPVPSLTIRTK
jgi:hypothetical protein